MSRIAYISFIIGVIILCLFFSPMRVCTNSSDAGYCLESVIVHTSIISDKGTLIIGRFLIYLLVWASICYALFLFLKNKNG